MTQKQIEAMNQRKATDPEFAARCRAASAATWSDPEVAAARNARHAVVVDGTTTYRSVAAAFAALGLPPAGVRRFRLRLVAEKESTFAGRSFSLAPR